MSVWLKIKGFFCRNNTDARDINVTLLAIRGELVILNNILRDMLTARVDNISINTSKDLTNPKEPAILEDSPMYIPTADTELEADIRLEEKDSNSEALDDAMAKFKAAKSVEENGKPGGFNE